jgi:methanogenic corrinoid protein MtbC1
MKHNIAAFIDSRFNLKIMIGGGHIDKQVWQYTDADAYRRNAIAAASLNNE